MVLLRARPVRGTLALVNYLPAAAVFMLMVSTGMSLEPSRFLAMWRKLTPGAWARLVLATFLVPPAVVLLLAQFLPLGLPAMGGLYLIAIAPGAPLLARNVAKHGFDTHQAASYQVWGALVAPIAIPALVAAGAWLYGRSIWIPPLEVLAVVIEKQFVPLLIGMAIARFAPAFSAKARRPLNVAGNVVLTLAIIVLLWKLGPALRSVGPWVAIAAVALAVACALAARRLLTSPALSAETLALSNVNRHVGLALLLSAAHFQNAPLALPAIAAYALAAPLVMALYARWMRRPAAVSPIS